MNDGDTSLDKVSDIRGSDESIRLGDRIEIIKGTKPDKVLEHREERAEKYLVVDSLSDGDTKFAIDDSAPRAKPEDVVMIMDGSKSGRVYPGEHGILGSTMASIRPYNANSKFIYYFLEDNFNRINSATKGSAVPHTDKDLVRSLEYEINSLEEQRIIASVLHTVDQAILKTEYISEQMENVQRGLSRTLFGKGAIEVEAHPEAQTVRLGPKQFRVPHTWDVTNISSIGKVVTGNTPSTEDENNFGGELPFVTPETLSMGKYVNHSTRTLSESGRKEVSPIREGSVMMDCIGSNMGKVAIAGCEVATNQQINSVVIEDSEYLSEFLYYHLRILSDFIKSQAGQTATPIVNKGSFESFAIFKPPVEEQRSIVEILSVYDEGKRANLECLAKLKRLKQGLMQDLLSGEVRTHDKDIEILDEILAHG